MRASDVGDAAQAMRLHVDSAADTEAFGARIAASLQPGMLVTLCGELGAGKTTLVRGMLRGLGWTGPVKSPTYTLVEHYILPRLYFYHFDFYRLQHPDEWETAGFGDYFGGDNVCVVEWPQRAGSHLPVPDLAIDIAYGGSASENRRDLLCTARSAAGERCLSALQQSAP